MKLTTGLDLTKKKDMTTAKELNRKYYNVKKMPLDLKYLCNQAMDDIFLPPDLHILLEVCIKFIPKPKHLVEQHTLNKNMCQFRVAHEI